MFTATAVLGILLERTHERQAELLQRLASRALLEDAERPLPLTAAATPELHWWSVPDGGTARAHGSHGRVLDPGTLAVAEMARREGRAVMRAGRPWEPLYFAAPAAGDVVSGHLSDVRRGFLLVLSVVGLSLTVASLISLIRWLIFQIG